MKNGKNRSTTMDTPPKAVLIGAMFLCFCGLFVVQGSLNSQRGELSPTYLEPLQDAPPLLALTTQSLGGFRGLISSYLWLRANEMQLQKKYQEQMQLSEWVAQLQPHVSMVWRNRAWNMAYNVSVTYEDKETRWKYVSEGVSLLRDKGIKYNPQEPLIYHELGWIFQHKIGHNMDNHHRYYKLRWMQAMTDVLWEDEAQANSMRGVPNFDELINPPNPEVALRVQKLREVYKLDPREMKVVNEKYGRVEKGDGKVVYALDWRKPETQAIYWGMLGLKRCRHNPSKENDLRKLERIVYQSMMYSFDRGKLNTPSGAAVPVDQYFRNALLVVPNMDLAERTHQSYLDMAALAIKEREANVEGTYLMAHMNFLRKVVEWNYYYNREDEAKKWLKVALEHYPEKMMYFTGAKVDKDGNKSYDLDEFVLNRMGDAVKRGSIDKTLALLIGLMIRHYTHLAMGEEEEADRHLTMAEDLHKRFKDRFEKAAENRVSLPISFEAVKYNRLRAFLIEEDPTLVKRLRTVLGLKEGEFPIEPQVLGPQPNPDQ
tara:strand:- start:52 stop:1680 length:1629 start_codon:yes stop_codon:yes gene_type:complete